MSKLASAIDRFETHVGSADGDPLKVYSKLQEAVALLRKVSEAVQEATDSLPEGGRLWKSKLKQTVDEIHSLNSYLRSLVRDVTLGFQ
jgi:hypothetical protein